MTDVDTSDGGHLEVWDARFIVNKKLQIQTVDQLKDLHGERITAEDFVLTLILSVQICKSARSADQSSSEVPLPQWLIPQDRNEDGSQQNKGRS